MLEGRDASGIASGETSPMTVETGSVGQGKRTNWRRRVEAVYSGSKELAHYVDRAPGAFTFAEGRLVDRWVPVGGKVLVVGSGGGRELSALQARRRSGIGIDLSRASLAAYAGRTGGQASPVIRADMACIPVREASFDTVLFFNQVIGHGPSRQDRVAALAEGLRVLKRDGTLLISFYVGAPDDFSVLLALWSLRRARAVHSGNRQRASTRKSRRESRFLKARALGWARGKWILVRQWSRLDRVGMNILVSPSGNPSAPHAERTPFHLYHHREFSEDVHEAKGRVEEWWCNTELNNGSAAPEILRRLDHLQFCVVRPTI